MRVCFAIPADPMQSGNFSPREPASFAMTAGGGWRGMPCGWRLRVAGGKVRAHGVCRQEVVWGNEKLAPIATPKSARRRANQFPASIYFALVTC
tara:strand:+ start:31 stop:312 length:282 start_codon:yes stop_codon:yes gene_type:complete